MSLISITSKDYWKIIQKSLTLNETTSSDTIGRTHQYGRHVTLNAKNEHYVMQKADEVTIVNTSVKKLNRR